MAKFSVPNLNRRKFLRSAGLLAAGLASVPGKAFSDETVTLPFAHGERELVQYPQKRPLIRLTTRPPQLETPFSVFNEGVITPNDAFFVRYHLAGIPTEIDPDTFQVQIKGSVNTPLTLSLADLKKFDATEVTAVLQCSGNSRGFSTPRVGGGQLANGAMGNAKWKGVKLKDLLDKAGLKAAAKQVTFNGLDKPAIEGAPAAAGVPAVPGTPDFVKALDVDHAIDGEVMLAYEMNGEALPMLNGFPLRLIVPGYFGTYWVKHVSDITVIDEVLNNFWMGTAYRIPDNDCGFVEAGTVPKTTTPIKRYTVRSFITSLADGARIRSGQAIELKGIAFDGGYGIKEVLISEDGGNQWREAQLGQDLGKYSFRPWTAQFTPAKDGNYELKVRAINRIGQSQPVESLWNPPGYLRNIVETIRVTAV